MATEYSEVPDNFEEIKACFITDFAEYKTVMENAALVVFYDTCAVKNHANLPEQLQAKISAYLKGKGGIAVITGCVLMELAGDEHHIYVRIIDFFKMLSSNGIKIILFEESRVYDFLADAYQSAAAINEKLRYAVRAFAVPPSTIRETVKKSPELTALVGDGAVPIGRDLCGHFFSLVRSHKRHGDNLGEQLIGICIYMLLHLPAEPSCKFTVYTDDKGAAGSISKGVKSIPPAVTDKRPGIFSSAKIFQSMYAENFFTDEAELKEAIKKIYPAHISVLALMEKSDLQTREYTFTAENLAQLISQGNTIRIAF